MLSKEAATAWILRRGLGATAEPLLLRDNDLEELVVLTGRVRWVRGSRCGCIVPSAAEGTPNVEIARRWVSGRR